jgi:hypothetical protein
MAEWILDFLTKTGDIFEEGRAYLNLTRQDDFIFEMSNGNDG